MICSQNKLVHFSFVPSLVPAGGMKLPADLTARQVMTAMCLCQRVSEELYDKLSNAVPAAEVAEMCRFVAFMREMDTRFPTTDTVFEYCVDPNQKGWLSWENKLSSTYRLVLPAFMRSLLSINTLC